MHMKIQNNAGEKEAYGVAELKMQLLPALKTRLYSMPISEIIYIKCVLLATEHEDCYVYTKQLICQRMRVHIKKC